MNTQVILNLDAFEILKLQRQFFFPCCCQLINQFRSTTQAAAFKESEKIR